MRNKQPAPRPVYLVEAPEPPRSFLERYGWVAIPILIALPIFYVAFGGRIETPPELLVTPPPTVDPAVLSRAGDRAEASFQATIDAKIAKCDATADPAAADACLAEVDALEAKMDRLRACLEAIVSVDQVPGCQRSTGVTP